MDLSEGAEAVVEAVAHHKGKKKGDTAYRLVVVILLLCLLCINLFMKNNYVSREDYKADQERLRVASEKQDELIGKMHDEILALMQSDKVNALQDETLRDHENRIRRLESRARVTPPKDTDPNGP